MSDLYIVHVTDHVALPVQPMLVKMIPVAVIDDQTLFREALAHMINGLGGYRVVVQAAHGVEYQQAVESGIRVDLAVVDLRMPVMDGFQTISWIRAHHPRTRTIGLTFEMTEDEMEHAILAGASGMLMKDVTTAEFRKALDQVSTNGHYLHDPDTRQNGIGAGMAEISPKDIKASSGLSDREIEFIRLVCQETEPTYEEIANHMGVTLATVHGYRSNIFSKLDLKSKAGLVIFAFKRGLI